MNKVFNVLTVVFLIGLFSYAIIGTSGNVEEIKKLAPLKMKERNWEIVRYEGWQYGSFMNHGGKVWYHVKNMDNNDIQYRVFITLWADELHYTYGSPEVVSVVNTDDFKIKTIKQTGE